MTSVLFLAAIAITAAAGALGAAIWKRLPW